MLLQQSHERESVDRVVHGGREHRKGKVISVGPTDVFIEFGPREIGVVTRQGWADEELPAVGDELEVVVEPLRSEGERADLCASRRCAESRLGTAAGGPGC